MRIYVNRVNAIPRCSTAFPLGVIEAVDRVSPVAHPAPAVNAPEDWRSPKPGGLLSSHGGREASWAVV